MFEFENNSIIICNNSYKNQILKKINKLVNVKFFSMNDVIKNMLFDYDYKTILYVIKKYNIKYEVALEYINNLYYVEDKKYNIEKLDFLVDLKNELIDNNLLIFNDKFKEYIKTKNIIIYNHVLNKFEKYILSNIKYKEVDTKNKKYIPTIYEFDNIEDEIEYVAYSISKLIQTRVDISKIKLTNITSDYINKIEKIFSFYNLRINKHNNIKISSTVIGKKFLNSLDIKSIDEYKNTDIYNKIIIILNKFVWCDDLNDLKILVEYEMNNTYISYKKYTNEIEVVDYNNYCFNDEYVFMLNFNQGVVPHLYKDEDYINDKIKPKYLDNTNEKNKLERLNIIKSINNIKDLTITYKLRTDFSAYYKSSIIDDLNVEVKHAYIPINESYSNLSQKIKFGIYLDNLIKFNEKSEYLDILNYNYNIDYNTYNNSFTGLNKDLINKYIKSKEKFNLSYSNMDDYNRCAFKFYIKNILNLKDTFEEFSVLLGRIYHHVLERAVKSDIDVEEEVNNFIKNEKIELTNSNKFFINITIDNLKYVISIIKKQQEQSRLNKIETEKNIVVPIKDNIYFKGFIDKIIYEKFDDYICAAIIDYKSYDKKPSLKYLDYGIGLQLPSYMYLSKYEYKNIKFSGFYLQNIKFKNVSLEEREKNLKLIGFTNTDKSLIEKLDVNYIDSSVIDGLKVNKDGSFSLNSLKSMLSSEKIDEIIDITKSKINETINNILESKFDINPKFDKENIGCEFCNFKDLCYMKNKDFVKINVDNKD